MKKIKLPRKRKKRYIYKYSSNDYKLMAMANQVCLEMDEKKRGFAFHSKFINKMDRRGRIISTW